MRKKRATTEEKCVWLKAKLQGVVAKPPGSADSLMERKFGLKAASEVFGTSVWTVRRMFKDEPGIIYIGKDPNSQRRAFAIPESILVRKYRERAA